MLEDLSVFSDETLINLYEDLVGAIDDGVGTTRSRQLLHRISMEQSAREIRKIPWEILPFRFIPICDCCSCRRG